MLLKNLYQRLAPKPVQLALKPLLHPLLRAVQWHIYRHAAGAIISGPFKGMKFGEQRLSLPIVAGTYELELNEVFQRLADRHFSRIIDIGAAEGYYAVGAALWQPRCQLIAYEANPVYHDSIRQLAQSNNVSSRVTINGACQLRDLQILGNDLVGSFIIVDVEGYEKELLDPHEVSALKKATILVEVHDNFVPQCEETIRRRFEPTHAISAFRSRPRHPCEYPIESRISQLSFMRSALVQSISDGRTEPNGWLLLEPQA